MEGKTIHRPFMPESDHKEVTIRDLFPDLSGEQQKKAEEKLDRYFRLVIEAYEEIAADPEKNRRFEEWFAYRQRQRKEKSQGRTSTLT